MKRALICTSLLAALVAVGCQQEEEGGIGRVPPPAYDSQQVETQPTNADMQDPTAVPAEPAPANGGPAAAQSPQPQPMPAPGDDAAADAGSAAPRTYTIKDGDTLWSIAQRMYGDGQRWVDIVRANPGLEPKKLRVGQEITLPR